MSRPRSYHEALRPPAPFEAPGTPHDSATTRWFECHRQDTDLDDKDEPILYYWTTQRFDNNGCMALDQMADGGFQLSLWSSEGERQWCSGPKPLDELWALYMVVQLAGPEQLLNDKEVL